MSDVLRQIREPILVIGSPRSGTTLLGNLIGQHPDVAYWEEPRTIWSQGNAWRSDDCLGADDLTPAIARRIDDCFARFLAASGRERFAEKTPSNSLRLPFIQALYPDARIFHLVRDGRAVVASMLRMLTRPPDPGRIVARIRDTPLRDLPSLAPLLCRDVIAPRAGKGGKVFWGPRPSGWREWLDLPVPVMLARQWKILVKTAREDLELFPVSQRDELRYEGLVEDARVAMSRIWETAELPNADIELDIDATRARAWRKSLDPETIGLIEAEAGEMLKSLGYSLVTEAP